MSHESAPLLNRGASARAADGDLLGDDLASDVRGGRGWGNRAWLLACGAAVVGATAIAGVSSSATIRASLGAAASGGDSAFGGARVRAFLETDELVSESARRWPAWRARVVPRIVASLLAIAGKDATEPLADAPGRGLEPPAEPLAETTRRSEESSHHSRDDASFAKRDEASNPARRTQGTENVPPAGVSR